MIKKYNDFETNEASTQAKGLDIKNEYTKLINDPGLNTLDLGVIDDSSDTDITNIQQTYKDSTVKVVDGHYILIIAEGTVIKFSDLEHLDESLGDFFSFRKKDTVLIEPEISAEISKILHQKNNGIAGNLGLESIAEGQPKVYDQILFSFDKDGFDSLKDEWKSSFIEMVKLAEIESTRGQNE